MLNQKGKMVNKSPPWADLDPDILRCVAAHLSFVDQSRLRSVCKPWRGICGVKPNDKSPWIIALNDYMPCVDIMQNCEQQSYHLYDVSTRKTYTLSINQYITNKYFLSVKERNVECIKLGWLLFNPSKSDEKGLFLFNAFTQEVVDLPWFPGHSLKFMYTFSYCERSRRFVVYAANRYVLGEKRILIHTWKSGDGEWETEEFVPEIGDRMKAIFRVECVGDTLYCVFTSGVVGTFQGGKEWSLVVEYGEYVSLFADIDYGLSLDMNSFNTKYHPFIYHIRAQLVEIEGDIFLVCCKSLGNHKWAVLRLDRKGKAWVEDVCLCGYNIYFSVARCFHPILASKQPGGEADTARLYYRDKDMLGVDCVELKGDKNGLGCLVLSPLLLEFPWRFETTYEMEHAYNHTSLWIEPPTL